MNEKKPKKLSLRKKSKNDSNDKPTVSAVGSLRFKDSSDVLSSVKVGSARIIEAEKEKLVSTRGTKQPQRNASSGGRTTKEAGDDAKQTQPKPPAREGPAKSTTTNDSNKPAARNVLPSVDELNETSEFVTFPKSRVVQRGQIEVLTIDNEASNDGSIQPAVGDEVWCQVCNKKLLHVNSQRRQQHVNRCIDKQEAEERVAKQQKEQLEAAKSAVLNCPMCGKVCKTKNSRQSHLKKCAQTLGVATDKMLQLVRDQESERETMLAAGVLPPDIKTKLAKFAAPKKKNIIQPRNQYEEDVQMAKAISSSLVEQCSDTGSHSSASTMATKAKDKRRKKNSMEDVCLLTTLSDAERVSRMEQKISTILQQQQDIPCSKSTDHKLSLQQSNLCTASDSGNARLWEKSYQQTANDNGDISKFYVDAIMPPVTVNRSVPGRNFRRLSAMPGREKSFRKKTGTAQPETSVCTEDIITVSTQTVAVLAQLAGEDSVNLSGSVEADTNTSSSPFDDDPHGLQVSGFCVENMILKKQEQDALHEKMRQDFGKMLNNPSYSDCRITSNQGQSFYAHKIILSSRCEKLLELMDKDSMVKLDAPAEAVKSLLSYLYTGTLSVVSYAQTDLCKLSRHLDLPALTHACGQLALDVVGTEYPQSTDLSQDLSQSKKCSESPGNKINKNFSVTSIDLKEIWGESDSDSNDDDDDGCHGNHSNNRSSSSNTESYLDREDYREMMCSQYKLVQQRLEKKGRDENQDHSEDVQKLLANESEEKYCTKATMPQQAATRPGNAINKDQSDPMPELMKNSNSETGRSSYVENIGNDYDVKILKDKNKKLLSRETGSTPRAKRVKLSQHSSRTVSPRNVNHSISSPEGRASEIDKKIRAPKTASKQETSRVTNTSCNTSVDLFASPSPKKICDSLKQRKSIPVQSPDKLCVTVQGGIEKKADSSKMNVAFERSSTPYDKLARNSHHLVNNRISNIYGSPTERFNVDASLHMEDLDTTVNEFGGSGSKRTEPGKSSAKQASTTDRSDNVTNTSSDDDLQITGDNFDEIHSSQSPTFRKTNNKRRYNMLDVSPGKTRKTNKASLYKLSGSKRVTDKVEQNLDVSDDRMADESNAPGENDSQFAVSDLDDNRVEGATADEADMIIETDESSGENEVKNDDISDHSDEVEMIYDNDSNECDKEDRTAENGHADSSIDGHVCEVAEMMIDNESNSGETIKKASAVKNRTDSVECVIHDFSDSDGIYAGDNNCSKGESVKMEGSSVNVDDSSGRKDGERNSRGSRAGSLGSDDVAGQIELQNTSFNQSGVWDDFDDCGMQFEPAPPTPGRSRDHQFTTPKPATQWDTTHPGRIQSHIHSDCDSNGEETDENNSNDHDASNNIFDVNDNCADSYHDGRGKRVKAKLWESKVKENIESLTNVEDNSDDNITDNSERKNLDERIDNENVDDGDIRCESHLDQTDTLLEDGDDSFVFKVDEEQQQDEMELSASNINHDKANFKTPVENRAAKKKKEWVAPSPFTPMPEYQTMHTPILKDQIRKYGVKPVGKKRMVNMLVDIYKQTHQYETDSDVDSPKKHSNDPARTAHVHTETRKNVTNKNNVPKVSTSKTVASKNGTSKKVVDSREPILPSSQPYSSDESDTSDVLEESCMQLLYSDSSDSSQSSPKKGVDLAQKLMDYIKSNKSLHLKILAYEPLELDVLKSELKSAGLACSLNKLMDFLDERCIAFTNKNTRKRPQARTRKGSKKTK